MSWLVFFLGIVLVAAGGAGLVASIDLLTTELGSIYATCGAIAVSGGIVTIAIGALIHRVDALRRPLLSLTEASLFARVEPTLDSLRDDAAPPSASRDARADGDGRNLMAPESSEYLDGEAREMPAPVNENRSGALSISDGAGAVARTGAPTMVGRYSAGGANYVIFSDGSIEAETDQGAFRFASMREFKAFVETRRA
jgi:hypothetical protein